MPGNKKPEIVTCNVIILHTYHTKITYIHFENATTDINVNINTCDINNFYYKKALKHHTRQNC